jgi:hypothetical protein
MSMNLTEASHQWAKRPADERFWGLNDLLDALQTQKTDSREYERKVSGVRAVAYQAPGVDQPDLYISAGQTPALATNWAFGQLCRYADSPPSYLATLPAELAVNCINNGLNKYRDDTVNMFMQQNKTEGKLVLRSFLTDHYNRLYNSDVVLNGLRPATECGWMVPPARPSPMTDPRSRPATVEDIVPGQDNFGLSVKVGDMIAPAGVYASDRDMFVFMVNPERVFDDGVKGLMRGFFMWNSEVGAGAFKMKTFMLESVCGNHICYGATQVKEVKVVHKGRAIDSMAQQVKITMKTYGEMGESGERQMITKARSYELGKTKEEVIEMLFNMKQLGLSKGDIESSYDTAVRWEHTAKASPRTAWGLVHGLTRFSQTKPYTDERHRLDSAGGKLLQLVDKSR